jgi:hypothetical protein
LVHLAFVIFIAGTIFAATPHTALAREPLELEAGKSRCIRLKRQVERHDISAEHPSIAGGRLDEDKNRFCITGLRRGATTVTFMGTYRRIIVGRELREDPASFRQNIEVVVRPPEPDVKTISSDYVVSRGKQRTTRLSVFLGSHFARRDEDGAKWRNLNVHVTPPNIVSTRIIGDRMMIEIAGVNPGRARIELSGERRVYNDWQKVLRVLEARVP